jgi:hypothetical protein
MSGIPGSNLLASALRVIKPTEVLYYQDSGRSVNDVGQYITTYSDPVTIMASVQSVNRMTYTELGLDFQKNYMNFWLSADVIDLGRDVTGDKIGVYGKIYQLESADYWFPIDGWVSVLGVEVPAI